MQAEKKDQENTKLYNNGEECEIVSKSQDGKYAIVRWVRSGTLRTTLIKNLVRK